MKLKGMNLSLVSVHRKGIFDMDAFAFCCENCGRTIVNSAIVSDETGKQYVIGLDCKKTLVDKKHIDKIVAELPEWEAKYKVKEFKRDCNELQLVMKYLDNPERYECKVDRSGIQYLTVYDNQKADVFGNMGATIYNESIGYLFKIGLKGVLQASIDKGIIKPH